MKEALVLLYLNFKTDYFTIVLKIYERMNSFTTYLYFPSDSISDPLANIEQYLTEKEGQRIKEKQHEKTTMNLLTKRHK